MAAPTENYVDPSGGNDTTGDGSVGNPWKTVQKALDTVTKSTTNGNRINIKAGAADVLGAALSFSTYGAGGTSAPLILQGYTSAAGDGGIGEIDGDATYAISAGNNYTFYRDLKMGNCGAANVVSVGGAGSSSHIINCEVYGTSGNGIVSGNNCYVDGCYVHDIGGRGCDMTGSSHVYRSYFANGAVDMVHCIYGSCNVIEYNIFHIDGATIAIANTAVYNRMAHNSILSASGTGTGIIASSSIGQLIEHNLIEGFSGAGGKAFSQSNNFEGVVCRNNSIYNCTSGITAGSGYDQLFNRGNETLASSPFAKSGSNTWANRWLYYAPQNVGSVYGGGGDNAYDIFRGAVMPAFSSGSASRIVPVYGANLWRRR